MDVGHTSKHKHTPAAVHTHSSYIIHSVLAFSGDGEYFGVYHSRFTNKMECFKNMECHLSVVSRWWSGHGVLCTLGCYHSDFQLPQLLSDSDRDPNPEVPRTHSEQSTIVFTKALTLMMMILTIFANARHSRC